MKFKDAVASTPDLDGAWRAGLQALKAVDRQRIKVEDTHRLAGSVDVEAALTPKYPDKRQWDYAIGHQPGNVKGETIHWVEVHPATEGEIKVVLAKLDQLQRWLHNDAPLLRPMPQQFVWISSGETSFTALSRQGKRLADRGLLLTGRAYTIRNEVDAA